MVLKDFFYRVKKEIEYLRLNDWSLQEVAAFWDGVFEYEDINKETIEETIKFSLELPLDMANFAVGALYTGTEFYKMAVNNGWLKAMRWEDFDQTYSAIVDYDYLPRKI